jgi:hypothetical protein
MEAKCFSFLAKARVSEHLLEERRKGFCWFIFLGLHSSVWLMATVEEALKASGKDFVKYFSRGCKSFDGTREWEQGPPPRGGRLS